MSKRKVQFAEGSSSQDAGEPSSRRFKGENSMDSDDDEGDEKAFASTTTTNVLNEDDIEGQEDETIKSYGDIKITPFNLKEEMEEGHFDAEGNYIADKDNEAIQDQWLDSVDWAKVNQNERAENQQDWDHDDEGEEMSNSDKITIMKNIAELLKPGENSLKALRRLGVKKSNNKKKQTAEVEDEKVLKENKENLLKLTELANTLLQAGDMEIYNKTVEKLNFEIKQNEEKFKDVEDDDMLEKAFEEGGSEGVQGKEKEVKENVTQKAEIDDNEVMWEYKWENKDDVEVYGPYSNSCMDSWKEQGFFKDGVFCRKVGSEGNYYSSKRIDFDLYS
eukprot:Seg1574.17 transcript_id=Seg1574.17/GoldUCD/mRNA.D3Y31 product="CD2 antigen cytoplasmic tail-binding protein 2" protein_id=Seg1574.17/GoldUCD/D3Y31